MYIITIEGRETEGAYSVSDEDGDKILYIFEEEDDATRFALQLEEDCGFPTMKTLEIDDDLMIKTCELHDHRYTVITPNDIVIPTTNYDTISQD
jgi:hypothetical protein|tara:strand:+ start:387 stop:668 length:282 start_codon:yes stop_codon:yes gene_type:complete